ncbi:cysteine desulfurase [bacterium]|nr:cysteine desulfurase [bacterium]
MKRPLYLDYNATTPLDPAVLADMLPYFTEKFGNSSSGSHIYGLEAQVTIDHCRKKIAELLNFPHPDHIIFTSGATEANNLALKGLAHGAKSKIHLITQKTEHRSILEVAKSLEKEGHHLTILPVDAHGLVKPADLEAAITPETALISIMAANNEIGTIEPIREIAEICREKNILFHTDAVQALGKIHFSYTDLLFDMMSFSGHKIYGPKGVGALVLGPRVKLSSIKPLFHGGGHQQGMRSGTLDTASIVGLTRALELSLINYKTESVRLTELRDYMIKELSSLKGFTLNGHPTMRLPNNIHFSLGGVTNTDLIQRMPQIAVSSGSACASGSGLPSHVMSAITQDQNRLSSSIRMSLGKSTTKEDVDLAIRCIRDALTL